MPRLILLNGPPAVGKSTLAQRYVDEHPLALNLDVDRVRSRLGCWLDHAHASGLLARSIALAAARTHLLAGHDVVVPQFVARPQFLEALEQLAREVSADFHEIVLMDSLDNVVRRFADRTRAAAEPSHGQAQDLLDASGGVAELESMHARLVALLASRTNARVIAVESGEVDAAYGVMIMAIHGGSSRSNRPS